MFRKPREEPSSDSEASHQILGRPPTPPLTPAKTPFTLAVPPAVPAPKMATSKLRSSRAVPLPTIGRQGSISSGKRSSPASIAKNGNIMSFFKKAEEEDVGLFVEERRIGNNSHDFGNLSSEECNPVELGLVADETHFNESGASIKRRRTGDVGADNSREDATSHQDDQEPKKLRIKRAGPFLDESDSEHGEEQPEAVIAIEKDGMSAIQPVNGRTPAVRTASEDDEVDGLNIPTREDTGKLPLVKEETSYCMELNDLKEFEGMDDFDEDIFEDGDEYRERRFMEEQARLEAEEAEYREPDFEWKDGSHEELNKEQEAPKCPICTVEMTGISEHDIGIHVNNCLDGNPTPLPAIAKDKLEPKIKYEASSTAISASQYRRPPRPPRPPQESPFTLGQSTISGGSAFNKLMSGHAEDAAWAQAAASEHASRGKPSYQRTCPFYKILPGLYICVDAFRYGAVQGCNAYFLSHFHSDHYVGLTSSWNHGPIYCSRVTANLVRQQLRVDPQYVVDLDWEKTIDIPGTNSVRVTMISANHCPGSSLYLFEKVVGKKFNGEPKTQRILHCGDFRACRMHVQHPLLMPNVRDSLKGTTKEQKIDVCYLDTTYLNPKYSFPSQEAVIKACADMCVSLSKHTIDASDGWEQMKKRRAGEGMVKFVRKESAAEQEVSQPDGEDPDLQLMSNPHSSQQVLKSASTPDVESGRGRLLVVVGTYSIGKERICLGIAKALNSKIYAPPSKQRIVAALEDPELDARMTTDPRAAQVHMTPLFEIRADTLDDYLKDYFPHFTRAVGFRPSGWNYRPPTSRFTDSPSVQTVLHSDNWKSTFSMSELVPQRGSSSRASCFGVPYSEHSSFRELTMFCCALQIEKIIPTVNVGSAKSREKMKSWIERWTMERKKNGPYQLPEDGSW